MSKRLIFEDKLPSRIRLVAGVDAAYTKSKSVGAIAVLNYDSLDLEESETAMCETQFPYVPTLLALRELPPTLLCVRKLDLSPDVFLADGHGFAHPYRCGFASCLGLMIRKPTIGVAKSMLFGRIEEDAGNIAFIKHDGEVIAARVVTIPEKKPVYVSVGHMISLKTAIKIVRHCTLANWVPEPIRQAHQIASREKRKIITCLPPNEQKRR